MLFDLEQLADGTGEPAALTLLELILQPDLSTQETGLELWGNTNMLRTKLECKCSFSEDSDSEWNTVSSKSWYREAIS